MNITKRLIVTLIACLCFGYCELLFADIQLPSTRMDPPPKHLDPYWEKVYSEYLQRQLDLQEEAFQYQHKRDHQKDEQEKRWVKQQRIMEIQQTCAQKDSDIMTNTEKNLCAAVHKNIMFGTPLTDVQLGLK